MIQLAPEFLGGFKNVRVFGFLVNADEGHCSREAIEDARKNFFRTAAGTRLLDSMYLRENGQP